MKSPLDKVIFVDQGQAGLMIGRVAGIAMAAVGGGMIVSGI